MNCNIPSMSYSQSKSSVHDKLHDLHSHFPPIAQRTPSIITSSCWKSTVSDITASRYWSKEGACSERHLFACSDNQKFIWLQNEKIWWCDYISKFVIMISTSKSIVFFFLSYKSPLFWTHIHFWLTGQTNLWCSFFDQYRMALRH